MDDRLKMAAACGLDCGICELYLSRNNQQLLDYLISAGIPVEKLPCDGCNNIEGSCPVLETECATYKCASQQGFPFCFECSDFPCINLAPAADRADILPHNMKVFNLCTIKKDGIKGFIAKSSEIKELYHKGKMVIGEGPKPGNA